MKELEWMQIISFIIKMNQIFKKVQTVKFVHTLIYKPSTNETVNSIFAKRRECMAKFL